MKHDYDLVVVGAGIAGLSVAFQASKTGKKVCVIETKNYVGGLCASQYIADCYVDFGVHLLHLRDSRVRDIINEVVPSELLVHVKRSGRLNIDDRYIEWPLKPISIFQLKLRHLLRILIEVIKKKKSPETGRLNYESVTKSIYGDYLYRIFFGPLTEKFFKVNPTEIDRDWAFASIRSATKIEDSGFSSGNRYLVKDANPDTDFSLMRNVLDSFKNLFSPEEFYYFKNGYGELAESFKRKIVENGGVFSLSTSLVSIEKIDNRVASCTFLNLSGTSNISFDSMLWTGSLEYLCKLLSIETPGLARLNSGFLYLFVSGKGPKWQTCYFPDKKFNFVRVTVLSNHSAEIIRNPNIDHVICLEYTALRIENLEIDINDEIKSAREAKILDKNSFIIDSHFSKAANSYPIFMTDYNKEITRIEGEVAKVSGIYLFGRQGAFTYENADILLIDSLNHPSFKL